MSFISLNKKAKRFIPFLLSLSILVKLSRFFGFEVGLEPGINYTTRFIQIFGVYGSYLVISASYLFLLLILGDFLNTRLRKKPALIRRNVKIITGFISISLGIFFSRLNFESYSVCRPYPLSLLEVKQKQTSNMSVDDYLIQNNFTNRAFETLTPQFTSIENSNTSPVNIKMSETVSYGKDIIFSITNTLSKPVAIGDVKLYYGSENNWYAVPDYLDNCTCTNNTKQRLLNWKTPIESNETIESAVSSRIMECKSESAIYNRARTQISGYLPRGTYRIMVDTKHREHRGIGFYTDKVYKEFTIE